MERCMKCGKRSTMATNPGTWWFFFKWIGREFNGESHSWAADTTEDLQRVVDTNGKMFVLCRECSGNTGVKLGRQSLNSCQPLVKNTGRNRC